MKNCYKFYQQYKEQYECEKGRTRHGALANILICLEKAIQDGNYVLIATVETWLTNNVFCTSVESTATYSCTCRKGVRNTRWFPLRDSPAVNCDSCIHWNKYPVQDYEHNHRDSMCMQKLNRIFMFLNSMDSSHCQSWSDCRDNGKHLVFLSGECCQ